MSEKEATNCVLFCPKCACQHIDKGEWATKLHRTHLCDRCGHEWMPSAFPTFGVLNLKDAETWKKCYDEVFEDLMEAEAREKEKDRILDIVFKASFIPTLMRTMVHKALSMPKDDTALKSERIKVLFDWAKRSCKWCRNGSSRELKPLAVHVHHTDEGDEPCESDNLWAAYFYELGKLDPKIDVFMCFPKKDHECDTKGKPWTSEDKLSQSVTCSKCGAVAMLEDMWRMP